MANAERPARAHAGARVTAVVVIVVVVAPSMVDGFARISPRVAHSRHRAKNVDDTHRRMGREAADADDGVVVARASEAGDVDEAVARVVTSASASAPSSAVRAMLLKVRRAHWRWSAILSLFAAGVLFATQYGTLEGVRRVMSDGYVTRTHASLASTSPTAAFASRARAP